MRNLMEKGYGPNDVFVATGGYGTKALQRDWIKRGLFNTPIEEPRAGKPRDFPYLAVVEAALMAEAARRGISVSTISTAVKCRLVDAAKLSQLKNKTDVYDRVLRQHRTFTEADIKEIEDFLSELDDTNIMEENKTHYGWGIEYEYFKAELRDEDVTPNDISEYFRVSIFDESKTKDILHAPISLFVGLTSTIRLIRFRQTMHRSGKINY